MSQDEISDALTVLKEWWDTIPDKNDAIKILLTTKQTIIKGDYTFWASQLSDGGVFILANKNGTGINFPVIECCVTANSFTEKLNSLTGGKKSKMRKTRNPRIETTMSTRTRRCFDSKNQGWKSKTFKNKKDCLTKQNGTFYEGVLNKNDVPNGKGKCTYNDGDIYEGHWKNGKKNGNFKHVFPNGDKFEGQYKNNIRNGKGKETYINGDVYEGYFKNGKKNGEGTYKFKDGALYEGHYKNNVANGYGKYKYKDGQLYEGHFKNNKRNGTGKHTYANGDVYEGQYKDGERNGKGKEKGVNGCVFIGHYKDGKCDGKGMERCKNKTRKGIWKNGKFTGK
jgi:hypothetical protein